MTKRNHTIAYSVSEHQQRLDRIHSFTDGGPAVCTCGHRGDGPHSQHGTHFALGHGACLVPGCDCAFFAWDHWYADDVDKGATP